MGEIGTYENFPAPLVAVSVLVTSSIYALGAFILSGYGPVVTGAYLLYCAFFEVRDGLVARVTNYYNLTTWLRQVGAS